MELGIDSNAKNAKIKALTTRSAQKSAVGSSDNTGRERGIRGSSERDGNVSGRTDGENWTQTDCNNPISGGILAQLIDQAKDQLGEAEACIQWYQEQREKVRKRLAELEKLQQLAENPSQTEK